MMRYRVSGVVVGGAYLGEVEAKGPSAALRKALEELDIGVSFCHQCSDGCSDPEITRLILTDEKGADFWEDL